MSFKKLMPFVIILVLLGGLVLLRTRDDAPPPLTEQVGLERLVPEALEAEDLAKIELYAAAKPEEKVILEKDDDTWKIATSYGAPADGDVVSEYAEMIAGLKGEWRAEAENEEELARYELKDDSSFRLAAYDDADGEPVVDLVIGKSAGTGAVFLRRAGENTVYTESANPRQEAGVYSEDMATAPTDSNWLDKQLLDYPQDQITAVALEMPGKSLAFEKVEIPVETPEPAEEGEEAAPTPPPAPEYEWQLASGGLGGEFKQTALDNLLTKVSSLRVQGVADPAKKAEWGLETPAYRATVTKSDGTEVVIEAGRPDPAGTGYVSIASNDTDLVYEVSSYDFNQLFPKGKDLFTLPEWDFTKEDADSIVIDQPSGRVVLSKVGGTWNVTRPALGLEAQTTKITTLVSTLASWKPEDYADPDTEPGAFDRAVSVSAGGKTYNVRVGGDAGAIDGAYAVIEGEDTILAMRKLDLDKIFLAPADLFKLKLMDLTESDVNEIEVRQGDTVITLARQGDGWRKAVSGAATDSPVTVAAADTAAADDLAYAITALQAKDVEPGRGAEVENLYASVTVKSNEGETHTLRIGPNENGEHALNFDNQGAILDLEADVVSNLLEKVAALTRPAAEDQETPADSEAAAEEQPAESAENTAGPAAEAVEETANSEAAAEETQPGAAETPEAAPTPAPTQP